MKKWILINDNNCSNTLLYVQSSSVCAVENNFCTHEPWKLYVILGHLCFLYSVAEIKTSLFTTTHWVLRRVRMDNNLALWSCALVLGSQGRRMRHFFFKFLIGLPKVARARGLTPFKSLILVVKATSRTKSSDFSLRNPVIFDKVCE